MLHDIFRTDIIGAFNSLWPLKAHRENLLPSSKIVSIFMFSMCSARKQMYEIIR